MKKLADKNSTDGYVAISILLILTAVLLGIMVTVAQLGIGEGQVSLALSKGEDTLTFVEACMEDALLKIRANSSLSGTFTIGRPPGEETCSVTVVSKLVNTWTVDVTTQATAYKRTVRVVFDKLSTGITLTSWKEI